MLCTEADGSTARQLSVTPIARAPLALNFQTVVTRASAYPEQDAHRFALASRSASVGAPEHGTRNAATEGRGPPLRLRHLRVRPET